LPAWWQNLFFSLIGHRLLFLGAPSTISREVGFSTFIYERSPTESGVGVFLKRY
jgi:hypothetical protein